MIYKYSIKVRLKLSDMLDSVKKIEDEINSTMHGFGFSENMHISSEYQLLTISTYKKLDEKEKVRMIKILQDEIKKINTKMEVISIEEIFN